MLLTERATKFHQLWIAISDVAAPEIPQFIRWCVKFDDALLERAIMKTGAKFSRTVVDPERAHRYATRLMFNLDEEQRCALSKTQ